MKSYLKFSYYDHLNKEHFFRSDELVPIRATLAKQCIGKLKIRLNHETVGVRMKRW